MRILRYAAAAGLFALAATGAAQAQVYDCEVVFASTETGRSEGRLAFEIARDDRLFGQARLENGPVEITMPIAGRRSGDVTNFRINDRLARGHTFSSGATSYFTGYFADEQIWWADCDRPDRMPAWTRDGVTIDARDRLMRRTDVIDIDTTRQGERRLEGGDFILRASGGGRHALDPLNGARLEIVRRGVAGPGPRDLGPRICGPIWDNPRESLQLADMRRGDIVCIYTSDGHVAAMRASDVRDGPNPVLRFDYVRWTMAS